MNWEGLAPPYSTIVVDPPWHYDMVNPPNPLRPSPRAPATEGAPLPYSSMTLDEIQALPVAALAEDTRCFLWTTNRYLRHAWDVLRGWGFEPQDRVLVWCKPPMGTLNVTTEFVLMGRRGNPARMPWHGTTWFQWPRSGGHSSKPAAFLDLVEAWCPGPYVELFSRSPRLGWDSWGFGYEAAVLQRRTAEVLLNAADQAQRALVGRTDRSALSHKAARDAVRAVVDKRPLRGGIQDIPAWAADVERTAVRLLQLAASL